MKNNPVLILFFLFAFISLSCKNKSVDYSLEIAEKAIKDKNSNWYADFKSYPASRTSLPIGIFDSGTGGLTVMESFLSMDLFDNVTGEEMSDGIPDFRGENFIYLADQANMPYGIYDSQGKRDYLRELIIKDALFLTKGENRSRIIVIACNTATSFGYDDIRSLLDRSKTGVKVVGVVNAGAKAALDNLEHTDGVYIGVLATVGTISSGSYQRTIREMALLRGFNEAPGITVRAGAGFAEAVDSDISFIDKNAAGIRDQYKGPSLGTDSTDIRSDLLDRYNFSFSGNDMLYVKGGESFESLQLNSPGNYARFHLVSLIEDHRQKYPGKKLDNIILGCTHYPYLIDTLRKVVNELIDYKLNDKPIYSEIFAESFDFIDPSQYTAKETYTILRDEKLLAGRKTDCSVKAYISVPSPDVPKENLDDQGNFLFSYKYGRITGSELSDTRWTLFSKNNINSQNLLRIQERVPLSFSLISNNFE